MLKLYPNTEATVAMQDYGSGCLMVLRGKKQDINLLFNSLYNFGAVDNIDLKYNETEDEAQCWTNKNKIEKFFTNFCLNRLLNRGHACDQLAEGVAAEQGKEMFQDFFANHREGRSLYHQGSPASNDFYSLGKITAERPDHDFKDKVLSHAFKDKEQQQEAVWLLWLFFLPCLWKYGKIVAGSLVGLCVQGLRWA